MIKKLIKKYKKNKEDIKGLTTLIIFIIALYKIFEISNKLALYIDSNNIENMDIIIKIILTAGFCRIVLPKLKK